MTWQPIETAPKDGTWMLGFGDPMEIEPCPKCKWPAMAMRRGSGGPWSVVCNNDGTCGDDVEPCGNEGPKRPTEAEAIAVWNARIGFVPCPLCKQYSHSIGEDALAKAFMHFQSMFSHRNDGIPTQFCFDETTRDAAQVLMHAARPSPPVTDVERVERAILQASLGDSYTGPRTKLEDWPELVRHRTRKMAEAAIAAMQSNGEG